MASAVVLSGVLLAFASSATSVEVSTKYGAVEGDTIPYPGAASPVKSVDRFLGVPFAAPPVGQRRFKPPEPPDAWLPNVYDATKYKSPCLQGDEYIPFIKLANPNFSGFAEDCLYLDIYTPAANSSHKFPVLVYIHGGRYSTGAASIFNGDMLALHEVVVVVIQYRLNLFGFMTSGDSHAPGNYGMLDQIQALKFIKENIDCFGGNPSQVTIFGESAGATSVSLLVLSPLSDGLFHRAIAESGVDLSPFAVVSKSDVAKATRDVAKEVGCNLKNNQDMVACMTDRTTANQLLAATLRVSKGAVRILFAPVVDGKFLLDAPSELRREGKFAKVDYMISFNRDDGSSELQGVLAPWGIDLSNGVSPMFFKEFIKILASSQDNDEKTAELIADAVDFQYTPRPGNADPVALRGQLVKMFTDFLFSAPSHAVAEVHSEFAPVYMYEFDRRPNGVRAPAWMGVSHAYNVPYSFGVPLLHLPASDLMPAYDNVDRNVSKKVMLLYANFARTGNPSDRGLGSITWEKFKSSHRAYLKIDEESKMAINYYPDRIAFWNEYYPKLAGRKLYKYVSPGGIGRRRHHSRWSCYSSCLNWGRPKAGLSWLINPLTALLFLC